MLKWVAVPVCAQVRLLQGRFEAADMESKELQDKLKIAHATNARLAAELEEASSLLLKYSEKKDTGREVEDMYRRRLTAAEQELHKAEYTYQVNKRKHGLTISIPVC